MHTIIRNQHKAIKQLCTQYHVNKLEAFGSITRETFDSEHSDIDLLVEFTSISSHKYADNYFALQRDLEDLLQHPVDLVVSSSIKNPYFLKSIAPDRSCLYVA